MRLIYHSGYTLIVTCDSTPIAKVFAGTLPRALAIALDPAPEYPSISRVTSFPQEKLQKITAGLRQLPVRPGLIDSFETLWRAGFEVYAVSNGAKDSTKALLSQVESKLKKDVFTSGEFEKYIISCDEVKMAKPAPDVVSPLRTSIASAESVL
jgi:2-haloacid dehalogenase